MDLPVVHPGPCAQESDESGSVQCHSNASDLPGDPYQH